MDNLYDNISLNNSSKNDGLIQNVEDKQLVINDVPDYNHCLIVSESSKKVYLPYSQKEIQEYLEKYPDQYESFSDVVNKEFICSLELYMKHPVWARFKEAYYLIRDREAKTIHEALKTALDVMFIYELNPAIIAACKSQEQLEHYIICLKNKNLNCFNDFEIRFEVNPLNV